MIRALYSLLTILAAPVAFAAVLLRGFRDRAHWERPFERFGLGRRTAAPAVWLHAVSMGEVAAASGLVSVLRANHPDVPLVITTATTTGRARAKALFGPGVDVRFLPYDTPAAVARFLDRVRPHVGIILETELWPNLIRSCRRRGIPVVLASARVTPKSAARYRRFGSLFRDAVAACTLIATQSSGDAERFVSMGADPDRTRVVGNSKFDVRPGSAVIEEGRTLRESTFGPRQVWIAGSTHAGEEEAVLAAHQRLLAVIPELLLILVPRHPQRFESVAGLLSRLDIEFDRRTAGGFVRPNARVLLVDTMGELIALYAASDVAFVGGSLVPVGGHNLLEPAALGVPVVTGPYTDNSKEIARPLIETGGAVEVTDAAALATAVRVLLQDPAARSRATAAARAFVDAHRGAAERLAALIDPLIRAEPSIREPSSPRVQRR
jgi:3-deoxy-D-manno-octulosonic-acid transferase